MSQDDPPGDRHGTPGDGDAGGNGTDPDHDTDPDAIPEDPDHDTDPDAIPEDPDIDDVFEELEDLAELVDTPAERRQVRRTMRALRRAERPRIFGLQGEFGLRDAGEAFVGASVVGAPMVVEDGTLAVGRYIAGRPALLGVTVGVGVAIVVGILTAVDFETIDEDLLFGVLPRRLPGILVVAAATAAGTMTVWGRVDWTAPGVAGAQVAVVAVVMAIGASLGDIIPES